VSTEKRTTEIRQSEIAQAALELIGRHGIKGLRVAAIAKKVGIVPSGLYRHYRSKEEVLEAILDYIRKRLSDNVREVSRMDGDALTRLHVLLVKHTNLIRENEAIPLVVFSMEVYAGSSRRRVKMLGIIESYLADVAGIIEQGQRDGVIRKDLSPDSAAMMFLGLVQPSAIVWHLSAGKFDVVAQAEAAWPLFFHAVRS